VLRNSSGGRSHQRSEPTASVSRAGLLPPDPLARYWYGTLRIGVCVDHRKCGQGFAMPTPGAEVTGTGAKPSPRSVSGQRQSRDTHRVVSGLRTSTRRAWPTAFRVKNAAVGLPRSVFGA
jgi:hypothetical protein